MAKILNWETPIKGVRTVKGYDFKKGDYLAGSKLYPIKTDKGTFNLDRSEVLSLLADLGFTCIKILTASALQKLVGADIDVSKIKDK